MTEYQSQGYASRRAYLESLCEEYPRSMVFANGCSHTNKTGLASMLGESEDFDGLVGTASTQTLPHGGTTDTRIE